MNQHIGSKGLKQLGLKDVGNNQSDYYYDEEEEGEYKKKDGYGEHGEGEEDEEESGEGLELNQLTSLKDRDKFNFNRADNNDFEGSNPRLQRSSL